MDILTKAGQSFRNWLYNEQPEEERKLTAEQEALETLGISEEEYEEILRTRSMTKLNRAMRFATQTDNSFGSFLSKAFYRYIKDKADQGNAWKRWGNRRLLRKLRELVCRTEHDDGDILTIVIYAYFLYRLKLMSKIA